MFIPDAGGDSKFDPVGMTVHMSCSDTFEDGWGSTAGPAEGVDTEWRVFSCYIVKAQGAPCGTPPPPEPGTIIGEKQTDPDGATATVDFTRDAAGTIGNDGTARQDTNKNGVQDSGEAGINDAKVILTDANGTAIATAATAKGPSDGWYKFVGLEAGRYPATIDMSSVDGKLTTAGSFTIDLEEGEEFLDADFGLYEEEEKEELPNTGLHTTQLGITGMLLLSLGLAAVFATRKRYDS